MKGNQIVNFLGTLPLLEHPSSALQQKPEAISLAKKLATR